MVETNLSLCVKMIHIGDKLLIELNYRHHVVCVCEREIVIGHGNIGPLAGIWWTMDLLSLYVWI